ncbi:DUF4176 domain-containing protein [Oscillibacter sp. CU971]|uniref:DUF4176 domain-containing protein n=1 Tax=Oscillibacter sp. CU971 TaxID=2780102 RepID=UPI001FAEBAA9|nr:DUF4176 domain-containing protein [Oscillibacter sp. CU971]
MSMNKRLLAVALMFSLFMSLAACSNQESPSNGTPESGAKGEVSDISVEYNEDEFLPIGSVVLLEGGNKRIMICGRIQAQAGSDIIYDYSACYYPEGIVDPQSMFFFNRDAIETVYFRGYEDQDELDYRHDVLDQLGELEIRDGMIVSKGS